MKNSLILFSLIALYLIIGCGGGGNADAFAGEWQLEGYTDREGNAIDLTDCDKQTVWNFTKEAVEPLADGTKVMKLEATAPEECKFHSFESKWIPKDGQLFISSVRAGGMGGPSNAGMFTIKEQSAERLALEIMGVQYTLKKAKN